MRFSQKEFRKHLAKWLYPEAFHLQPVAQAPQIASPEPTPFLTFLIGSQGERSSRTSDDDARRILCLAMARMAGDAARSHSVSRVELPKGTAGQSAKAKIVGKEGRNIRSFQEKSGVDLILNDEHDRVLISSFDVTRREIARVALIDLLSDGRIHPERIDLALANARKTVDQAVRQKGSQALEECGIQGVHPAIVRVLANALTAFEFWSKSIGAQYRSGKARTLDRFGDWS